MLKIIGSIMFTIIAAAPLAGCATGSQAKAQLDWCLAAGETYTRNSPYAQLPGEALIDASAQGPTARRFITPWWQVRNDAYLNIRSARPSADLEVYEVDIHDHQRVHDGQVHDHYSRRTRIIRQGAMRR